MPLEQPGKFISGPGGRPVYVEGSAAGAPVATTTVTLAAAAAVTAAGNGAAVNTGAYDTARVNLNVTAATGTTPSIVVRVQHSPDGTTGWTTVASFPAATAVGTSHLVVPGLDQYVRVAWDAPTGTTPSFAFNVAGVLA